ncbi:MAG: TonB-dependent siderophore receptor [Alphaproteobacteria bacterium]|nr:TonB-dependent siderophore receptor [Alphaproteobacteria bacterium]MBU1552800.1 TonB-dependent siderophore receptor [Alphaproteobacteria bacterium]MBU2337051.1 TonB-dependent siderophore receptor [Alphaproteobacteria bacterium]MBU2389061.1 TonB-dependent siderophore receptor [Alphaproteobacteria bacterium]
MGELKAMQVLLKAGAAMAVMTAAVPALAQETQLETIVIEGQGSPSAVAPVRGYVAKTSSAGSKGNTPLSEIPQSVSVIGQQEFQDRGITNKVDELLRYTPGVVAQPYGSDPDTDWYFIRGFNATQTGVYFDDLNLFSYGFGGFQIDPFMLERVDVLKGPASVLYGGANAGGIVNMIRKRPTDDPLYLTETGINSNGNAFFGFDVSDAIREDGTMSYRLTGKIAGGDNDTDYSEDLRGFVMPQLTIAPDDATSLTLWGYAGGLDQVHSSNGFLPYVGTVVDAPFGRIDREAFFGEPDLDTGRYDQQMIGFEFDHEFDNGWAFTSSFRYGHLDKYETGPYPYLYVNTTNPADPGYYRLNRIGFEGDTSADTVAWDNRVEKTFDLGGAEHAVLAGIDYRYYRLDNVQNSLFGASSISPTNPVYGLPQPNLNPLYDQELKMNQLGVYAQDQIRFGGGWIVTLNGRYDFVRTEMDDRLAANDDYDTSEGAWSGRAGLAYEFDNGVTPYVSAATFFNPLVGMGLQGPLVPEEGEQFEAGVKFEPGVLDASFTASVFHINKQNNVVSVAVAPWQDQLGEVRSQGVELEGKVNLNENWRMLGSFTYADVEVTGNAPNPALVGNAPYIVPDVTASLWLDYAFTSEALDGLSIGAGLRYKGESFADEANTLKVPDATLVDAAIRYQKNDWTASLNVANLFDKDYVESCGGVGACGYGEARTVTFKLSKTW